MHLRWNPPARVVAATVGALAVAAPLAVIPGTANASPPPDPKLPLCSEVNPDFTAQAESLKLSGKVAAELQCGFVDVPVDYAKPDGPTTKVAFSRLPASDPQRSRGVLFTHTGGPGGASLTYPVELAVRPIGKVVREYDTVSMDYRGVGASDPYTCAPATAGNVGGWDKRSFGASFAIRAKSNKALAQCNPSFTRNLNTMSFARDMDKIRERLGVSTMAYYGVSYGTVVGSTYRALFDNRVSRMWLDSLVDPELSEQSSVQNDYLVTVDKQKKVIDELAARDSDYRFGSTPHAVRATARKLIDGLLERHGMADSASVRQQVELTVLSESTPMAANTLRLMRDGGTPDSVSGLLTPAQPEQAPSSYSAKAKPGQGDTYTPVYCAFQSGGRDFESTWDAFSRWRNGLPQDGPTPSVAPNGVCAGWPFPAQRPDWKSAPNKSPLMIGGHRYDSSTPLAGVENGKKVLGGSLLVSNDGLHSGTILTQCGEKKVSEFLRGAEPRDSECMAEEDTK